MIQSLFRKRHFSPNFDIEARLSDLTTIQFVGTGIALKDFSTKLDRTVRPVMFSNVKTENFLTIIMALLKVFHNILYDLRVDTLNFYYYSYFQFINIITSIVIHNK